MTVWAIDPSRWSPRSCLLLIRALRAESLLAAVGAVVALLSSAVITALIAGAFMMVNTMLLWWLEHNERRRDREDARREREALEVANGEHRPRRRKRATP